MVIKKKRKKKVVKRITKVILSVPPKVFASPSEVTWPTYEEARAMVRARGITNRKHYRLWHKLHRIRFLPYKPDAIYGRVGGWVGWGDFLGNDNTFERRKDQGEYLPFWQAAREVHKLGIKSVKGWYAYIKDNQLPEGVCRRPDCVYRDMWNNGVAWTEWLGLGVNAVVEGARVEEGVLWWVVITRDGRTFEVLRDKEVNVNRDSGVLYRVLGKYVYEVDLEGQLWEYLDRVSVVEEGVVRYAVNLFEVVNGLNRFLLMVR